MGDIAWHRHFSQKLGNEALSTTSCCHLPLRLGVLMFDEQFDTSVSCLDAFLFLLGECGIRGQVHRYRDNEAKLGISKPNQTEGLQVGNLPFTRRRLFVLDNL